MTQAGGPSAAMAVLGQSTLSARDRFPALSARSQGGSCRSAKGRFYAFAARFRNGRFRPNAPVTPSPAFWRIALIRHVGRSGAPTRAPQRPAEPRFITRPLPALPGLNPNPANLHWECSLRQARTGCAGVPSGSRPLLKEGDQPLLCGLGRTVLAHVYGNLSPNSRR